MYEINKIRRVSKTGEPKLENTFKEMIVEKCTHTTLDEIMNANGGITIESSDSLLPDMLALKVRQAILQGSLSSPSNILILSGYPVHILAGLTTMLEEEPYVVYDTTYEDGVYRTTVQDRSGTFAKVTTSSIGNYCQSGVDTNTYTLVVCDNVYDHVQERDVTINDLVSLGIKSITLIIGKNPTRKYLIS